MGCHFRHLSVRRCSAFPDGSVRSSKPSRGGWSRPLISSDPTALHPSSTEPHFYLHQRSFPSGSLHDGSGLEVWLRYAEIRHSGLLQNLWASYTCTTGLKRSLITEISSFWVFFAWQTPSTGHFNCTTSPSYNPFSCMFHKVAPFASKVPFYLIYMRDLVFIPKKFVYDVHRNKQRKKERNVWCECRFSFFLSISAHSKVNVCILMTNSKTKTECCGPVLSHPLRGIKKKASVWVSVVTASHPWLPAPSGLIFQIISSARALIPLAFPPRRALEWVAAGCVYRTRRPLCGPMRSRLYRLHILHPVCRLLRTLFCLRSATLTWVRFWFHRLPPR